MYFSCTFYLVCGASYFEGMATRECSGREDATLIMLLVYVWRMSLIKIHTSTQWIDVHYYIISLNKSMVQKKLGTADVDYIGVFPVNGPLQYATSSCGSLCHDGYVGSQGGSDLDQCSLMHL